MAVKFFNKDIVCIGSDTVYDPNNGPMIRTTYRGSPSACESLAIAYNAAGMRATVTVKGGIAEMNVYANSQEQTNGGIETPIDKWEITTDYIQAPIWGHPLVHTIASSPMYGGAATVSDAIAFMRRDMELALKGKVIVAQNDDGTHVIRNYNASPLPPSQATAFTGNVLSLYKTLCRGDESFPIESPVLSRVRTYSTSLLTVNRLTGRMKLPEVPEAYTTATLITRYAIPASVQSQLPDNPTTKPEETEWAWRERAHKMEINYVGKVTETQDWVFGAISTAIYLIS